VVVEEEEKAAVMSSRSIKTKPAVIIMDRKTKVMTTLCTLMSHLIHARRNATTTQANATDMITELLITNYKCEVWIVPINEHKLEHRNGVDCYIKKGYNDHKGNNNHYNNDCPSGCIVW
jgi:hypothetical protein